MLVVLMYRMMLFDELMLSNCVVVQFMWVSWTILLICRIVIGRLILTYQNHSSQDGQLQLSPMLWLVEPCPMGWILEDLDDGLGLAS